MINYLFFHLYILFVYLRLAVFKAVRTLNEDLRVEEIDFRSIWPNNSREHSTFLHLFYVELGRN